MSNSSQFASGSIKSIQRGTVTIAAGAASATATISAVNMAKASISFLGQYFTGTTSSADAATVQLTNSTTITATKGAVNGSGGVVISYQVLETY